MIKPITSFLGGILTTILVEAIGALISIHNENKRDEEFRERMMRRHGEEAIQITGADYKECAEKLIDIIHEYKKGGDIFEVSITLNGEGTAPLQESINSIKEVIDSKYKGLNFEWNVGKELTNTAGMSVRIKCF